MSDNDNGSGGFGWFLAGLGIGALIGVLYAPKAGKDTRDDLVAGALDARDKANEYYGKGVEAAAQYAQQGREVAGQYIQQGRETVGAYVDKGREYYDKGRTQWSEYVDRGKGLIQEQADKVAAAVDAGKEAYVNTTSSDGSQG